MHPIARLELAWKAVRQIGPARLAENGLYRLGLRLGAWKIPAPLVEPAYTILNLEALPPLPTAAPAWPQEDAAARAQEIIAGQARLFGAEPVTIELVSATPLQPWQAYELARADRGESDIKFTWEAARFSWAVHLARAACYHHNRQAAASFWHYFEIFQQANPAYWGPNWISGQEAALRMMAFAFVLKGLATAPESTPERMQAMGRAIAEHAARIPPTLIYARSQDNNHLLAEAAGLYTAGLLLPQHPWAAAWRRQGWAWFHRAMQRQISTDGAYIQQSVNYHRVMLHLALWVHALAQVAGEPWPQASRARVAAAVGWLQRRVDPHSGQTANFGHNDGAHLFPFGEFSDYRPTLQAAALAFTGQTALPPGPWDELGGWLGLERSDRARAVTGGSATGKTAAAVYDSTGAILRAGDSWAGLRAGPLLHRPGQADQTHVDLWWRGQPLTLDAGTYRYSAPPPWQNALSGVEAHNVVMIDDRQPMTRAGRFLWLDWDQGAMESCLPTRAVARRSGYQKIGVRHRRTIQWLAGGTWQISDDFAPLGGRAGRHTFTLHWLLPDVPWQWDDGYLTLAAPPGSVMISLAASAPEQTLLRYQLIRAGEVLMGSSDFPSTLGWFSPTYSVKHPALSLRVTFAGRLPAHVSTFFALDSPFRSR